MMAGIEGFGNSPFKQFQIGQSIKQNSEANILAAQSAAKRSPLQNIKAETRIDTSAPVQNTPLQEPRNTGSIIRGGNLDISV